MQPHERIIVALDVSTREELIKAVSEVAPHVGMVKLGLEALMGIGVASALNIVYRYSQRSWHPKVFLDGKFADIPNTVGAATRAVMAMSDAHIEPNMHGAEIGFLNVHASCGRVAMEAAANNKGRAKMLAVTVLTSLSNHECFDVFGSGIAEKVRNFAIDAALSGMDGIVCSPDDLKLFDPSNGPIVWKGPEPLDLGSFYELTGKLLKVTPGVRPAWAAANDQKRVMTPGEAIRAGADYLVIGRPILRPPSEIGSPLEAIKRIVDEIAEATR